MAKQTKQNKTKQLVTETEETRKHKKNEMQQNTKKIGMRITVNNVTNNVSILSLNKVALFTGGYKISSVIFSA